MLGLLLDSSEKELAVGFVRDGKVIVSKEYEAWQRQSELMVQEIATLSDGAGIDPKDLDFVVCSKGPGSYTGVRIALTVGKTVSFALGIPLYLASSLEILQKKIGPCICLSNARSRRSYVGIYDGSKVLLQDCIMDNQSVLDLISEHPEYHPCGDLAYLGLPVEKGDIFENLFACADASHLCEEPLGAKPVYLKDDYGQGGFKCIVRKAIPSDVSQIMAIERSSFSHPYEEEDVKKEISFNPFSHFYCAVVDSEVVGYIDFMITFNSATIVKIAVRDDFRRKGIGNMLLGQALKDCSSQAEPVEFMTLEVRVGNAAARSFYKKHKFEEVTVKKSYYSDGEDASYMVRCLING